MTTILPRGIRLNNPGNIDRNHIAWQGESTLQDDPRFIRFDAPVYGLRALMKVLHNYQAIHGKRTIRAIVDRWAPPNENFTEKYISDVCGRCRAAPDDFYDLSDRQNLIRLAKAIAHHENGNPTEGRPADWYEDGIYEQAAALALP